MQAASTPRPAALFDREAEWSALATFAASAEGRPGIGIVHGRRRHGKTWMLEHLARATGGFVFQALEETREAALGTFQRAVSSWGGLPALPGARFEDWPSAIRAACEIAGGRPIVIDELPYLLRDSGELPSAIQAAFDAARSERHPWFRLLLCGSALSVMTQLLTGTKALRGRARLDLMVDGFDFRQARAFWRIGDPSVAFLVDAVIGGAPGYRELLDDPPHRAEDIGEWLSSGILNPAHALFREADFLLSEDPSMTDRALYRSIIASVAGGQATRTGVARELGRKEGLLDFPLRQLERARFVVREHDLLRPNRPLLRVPDPILRFHFAVLRRDLARFEARHTRAAWRDAQERFASQVVGPHFESMARAWTRRYASDRTVGGPERDVGFVRVHDAERRQAFEVDVVVVARRRDRVRLVAIGEAKGGSARRRLDDLARLERLRGLLAARADTTRTRLLLFGRAGFEPDVVEAARGRSDVELVDLHRMYEGE
jgi:uncharacterized protein